MTEPGAPPSILVVDDTPANIGFLVETLSKAGFRVRVAQDGESALEQAQDSPPCLVLLDVVMPGIDGFETCRRLRRIPKLEQLPVIFMTALSDAQDKVRAFEAGADDYITKPFQYEEVLARVRTQLTRRELERKLEHANADLEARVAARTSELSAALAEVERLKIRLQQENRYLRQEVSEAATAAPAARLLPAVAPLAAPVSAPSLDSSGNVLTLEALERAHFITVLRKTRGVIEGPKGAARLLDLKPSTARFRMKKLGITKPDYLSA